MNNQSKLLLPLIEILISAGIFSVAVVLTLQLFLLARFLGNKTSDTAEALFTVQLIAEMLKSFDTESETDEYIDNINNGVADGKTYSPYYDKNWREVDSEAEAVYAVSINPEKRETGAGSLYKYTIELYKTKPYPFVDDKRVEADSDYRPLLASVNVGRFVTLAE